MHDARSDRLHDRPARRCIAPLSWIEVVLTFAAAAPAAAQDNAVSSAADAFGERAGIEQSGLYTESQVRGFDLNDSGAYRIDDAYFSRAASAGRHGAVGRRRARRRERRAPRLTLRPRAS